MFEIKAIKILITLFFSYKKISSKDSIVNAEHFPILYIVFVLFVNNFFKL